MKKIIITGGDNSYCCYCGGVGDRAVMEEDTDAKTLKYIHGGELCLGKYCWREMTLEDGTELRRDWGTGKVRAYRNGVELPCVVRNQKWGKDGEFGKRGNAWAKRKDGEDYWRLIDWKDDESERAYWAQYDRADYQEYKASGKWRAESEFCKETGWKLLAK